MGYRHDVSAKKPAGGFIRGLLARNTPEQMLKRDIANEATQDRFEGYLVGANFNTKDIAKSSISVCRITPEGVCVPVEYALRHIIEVVAVIDAKTREKMAAENPAEFAIVLELYVGAETGKLVRLMG